MMERNGTRLAVPKAMSLSRSRDPVTQDNPQTLLCEIKLFVGV